MEMTQSNGFAAARSEVSGGLLLLGLFDRSSCRKEIAPGAEFRKADQYPFLGLLMVVRVAACMEAGSRPWGPVWGTRLPWVGWSPAGVTH